MARATTSGCRDPRDPTRIEGVEVPGGLVFAGESRVWHGGMAFYDRTAPGVVAGCAYLVTTEQFADVAAQELRRPPGGEFAHDLSGLLPDVESVVTTGPGLYETVVRLGELDGAPMFTITHHDVGEPAARGADGGVPAVDRDRAARGARLRRRPDRPLPRRRPGGRGRLDRGRDRGAGGVRTTCWPEAPEPEDRSAGRAADRIRGWAPYPFFVPLLEAVKGAVRRKLVARAGGIDLTQLDRVPDRLTWPLDRVIADPVPRVARAARAGPRLQADHLPRHGHLAGDRRRRGARGARRPLVVLHRHPALLRQVRRGRRQHRRASASPTRPSTPGCASC